MNEDGLSTLEEITHLLFEKITQYARAHILVFLIHVSVARAVALFVSCGDAFDPSKKEKAYEDYLLKLAEKYPLIQPVSLGLFAGVYNPEKYVFVLKQLMKQKSKYLKTVGADLNKSYDMRDWDKITVWAQGLVKKETTPLMVPIKRQQTSM